MTYQSTLKSLLDGVNIIDQRDAAIVSLLLIEGLSRMQIRELTLSDCNNKNNVKRLSLTIDGKTLTLNKITRKALYQWLSCTKSIWSDMSALFVHCTLLNDKIYPETPLSAQHIHQVVRSHQIEDLERERLPLEQRQSVLLQLLSHRHNDFTVEAGYTPNNLRALRHHYGLSQKDVAKRLGVTVNTAHGWEVLDYSSTTFRNMPLSLWLELIKGLSTPEKGE